MEYVEKLEPTICKESEKVEKDGTVTKVPPAYKGTISLIAPTFDERLDLQDVYNAAEDQEEEAAEEEVDAEKLSAKEKAAYERKRQQRGMRRLRRLAKFAPKFVKSVELVRVEDGVAIKSWDQLSRETGAMTAVMEVCTRLVGPWKVGNESSPAA
jgi:hypothetical protein